MEARWESLCVRLDVELTNASSTELADSIQFGWSTVSHSVPNNHVHLPLVHERKSYKMSLGRIYSYINQPHLLSFLRRCPTLETLHISHMIFSRALEAGEPPVDMPNLWDYEGRAEYLTFIRAPALRRVVVRSLQWDGAGAVIRSLASTQSCLETVVLDLAARMDGPAAPRIKVCLVMQPL